MSNSSRIASIDLLRGLVMVLMALDHVRDYFYVGSFYGNPTDLTTTTGMLFFTRWITHFCAPVFIFLAGTSASLFGQNKEKKTLSKFLWTRGLWLIFLEIAINGLIWSFDLTYSMTFLQVIWVIGICMICLAGLIYLKDNIQIAIGVLMVAGHNLLDGITFSGTDPQALLWYFLHQQQFLVLTPKIVLVFAYPAIPWIGVMLLGYQLGRIYHKTYDREKRRRFLLNTGIAVLGLFFILRILNLYGDPVPWSTQDSTSMSIASFFNLNKYPPSLLYLCMTLGPSLLFLWLFDKSDHHNEKFLLVFGKVPLFYYLLHVLVIHIGALIAVELTGGDWRWMILSAENFLSGQLGSYGFSLPWVYLIWIAVVLICYPFSRMYMAYKLGNKDKWWLSYL